MRGPAPPQPHRAPRLRAVKVSLPIPGSRSPAVPRAAVGPHPAWGCIAELQNHIPVQERRALEAQPVPTPWAGAALDGQMAKFPLWEWSLASAEEQGKNFMSRPSSVTEMGSME